MRGALLALLAALAAAGCAPALRPPRSIEQIAGGESGSEPALPADRRAQAEALLARADTDSVRDAAQLFLQAAAEDPEDEAAVLGAVRAKVWLADHETTADARRAAASSAVETVQWCGRLATEDPQCSYWRGVALGVQAREKPSTGRSAIPLMIEAFGKAAEAEPGLDHAGPHRALALIYLRAPSWPAGPGDPDKGLEHARKAASLEAGYPPNLLALAEALEATGDHAGGQEAFRSALALARDSAGDPDSAAWVEEATKGLDRKRHE